MRLSTIESIIVIIIIAIATFITRVIPFVLFPSDKKKPAYVDYLGKVLPFAMIGMLVVYCLKSVRIFTFPYGFPEVLAIIIVVLLHLWKKNILLSILSGTVFYMFIIQTIV